MKRYISAQAGLGALLSVLLASAAAQGEAATSGASDQGGLDEVVVTARRQTENLQKVPLSASVFDSSLIKQTNMTSIRDVQYVAPSLNISSNTTRNSDNYTLRGQGTTYGTDPAVVGYFAEVPMPGGGGGSGMLFDLADIQVLNGPQGTLFGRNTTGGAILFEPQRPTDKLAGYVTLGYGNHNNFQQEAVVNIPLAEDKVLFRAGMTHRTRNGFTRDVGTGTRYDNINYLAARASLLVKPVDGIENYTVVNYTDRDEHGVGTKLSLVNPLGPAAFIFGQAAQAAADEQAVLGPRRTRMGVPQQEQQKVLTIVNRTTVGLTDTIDLKNIVSFTRFRSSVTFDNDGSVLPLVDYFETPAWGGPQNNATPAINQFTDELQLSGKTTGGMLSWTIGGYYQHNQPKNELTAQRIFGGPVVLSRLADELTSKAVFGQGTLDFGTLTPSLASLRLTLGYRHTHDRREDYTESYLQAGNSFEGGGACSYLPGSYPNCRYVFAPRNFSADTYTAALSYEPVKDVLLYATARSGFKSGGFNLIAPPASAAASFGPEKVDDIELGAKATVWLGDIELRTSVAGFRDRYKDIQRALPADFGGGVGVYVVNATNATIKGIEVQADAALSREFKVGLNYSYLDAHYGAFISPQGDFSGMRLPYTPKHKLALKADYQHELGAEIGTVGLHATYAYQSSYRNLDAFDPDIVIKGYGLLNLSATWNGIGGTPIDATIYANNVTGKLYRIAAGNYYYSLGYTTNVFGEPRIFGINLSYHF